MPDIEVRQITAAETIPIRHSVLRPGRPVEQARFPGDDDMGTIHLGVFRDGQLECVGSLFQAPFPGTRHARALQLRGMATAAQARGTGLGTALVRVCLELAREKGIDTVWCNARSSAAGFYTRLGFEPVGEEFEIADVGPHFRMRFRLTAETSRTA